jgi:1,4-dihydroxy-2-naphthoyl-CoA synthase
LEVGTLPYEDIIVEVEGNLQIVKLNRPEVRNALRERTLAELYSALKEFEDDEGTFTLLGQSEFTRDSSASRPHRLRELTHQHRFILIL